MVHKSDYAYAVTSVRVKENQLLTGADFSHLADAATNEEQLEYLTAKGWHKTSPSEGTSAFLRNELLATWDFLTEIAPDISLLHTLILRKDYHNLKAGLKSSLSGVAIDKYFLLPCTVSTSLIEDAVSRHNFSVLPPFMASIASEAYEILTRTGDGQLADIIIDRAALEHILREAKRTGSAFLLNIQELFVAAADIKTAFRAARMNKPREFFDRAVASCETLDRNALIAAAVSGEEELLTYLQKTNYADGADLLRQSPALFEKWCDDRAVEMSLDAKYISLGPEPLIAYYLAREAEIKNVRILISAVANGIHYDIVRARLRRLYA